MTNDRDLSMQLETWLDDRATSVVPDGLLARSLARVEATRQRPRWLVATTLPTQSGVVGRPFVPAWAVLVLVALLAVVVVAVGSQLFRPTLSVIADPTLTPTQSPPAESAPAATKSTTPTPVDTRPPAVPLDAAALADLGGFFGADDDVAWIYTASAIYRTEDTGRTWRAVTPAGWTSIGATTFVDANTAYFSPGGARAPITVTHDAGASWTTVNVNTAADVAWPIFSFRSSSSGYATFVDPALYDAPAGTGVIVFKTTDGGVTWTGPERGVQPHTSSFNKVNPPVGGFLIDTSKNSFYLSDDGGVTWRKYPFPSGPLAPKNVFKGVADIVREPNGHLLVTLDVDTVQYTPQAVYETADDIPTWRLAYQEPATAGLQFLSDTTWVMTTGYPAEVSVTTDSGAHWDSHSATGAPADDRRFATVRTGWGLTQCQFLRDRDCGDNPHSNVLFVTKDGGASWTEVGR
jgi:hypothetical protein